MRAPGQATWGDNMSFVIMVGKPYTMSALRTNKYQYFSFSGRSDAASSNTTVK